jgi:hypothetical protein
MVKGILRQAEVRSREPSWGLWARRSRRSVATTPRGSSSNGATALRPNCYDRCFRNGPGSSLTHTL